MSIPVLLVRAKSLPEGWENAVLSVWQNGASIETQYDKPGDPPSKDATMIIEVEDPFAEPRIHRAMPGGFYDLENYVQEVLYGIHDHWVNPSEGKWQYTYHERLNKYSVPGVTETVDQIEYIIDALVECAHTRRAQAVVWKPWEDPGIHDPACLQRIWCRIHDGALQMNVSMRSNDAYKAAYMNIYAFTELQKYIARVVSHASKQDITVGKYVHMVDSFHIYGSYFDEFSGFLKSVEARTWEQRTYRTEDVQELFDEARVEILAKREAERNGKRA